MSEDLKCSNPMHPPHARQRMRCAKCAHSWIDCPGTWGVAAGDPDRSKHGCPQCKSLYWQAGVAVELEYTLS